MGQWGHQLVKKSKDLISIAFENITKDREKTTELLQELSSYIVGSYDKFAESGNIAAKYLETLQRSNEQLVKLCGLMAKNEKTDELTDKDFAQIFDQIKKSENEK